MKTQLAKHEKPIFAITDPKDVLIVGIPEPAWEYIRGGKTLTFDLRRFGVEVRLIIFGGKTQAELKGLLNVDGNTLDVTGLDVGFGGE